MEQDTRSGELRVWLDKLRQDVSRQLEDESLPERTRQITAGLPLVAEAVCRYLHTGAEPDDLIQIGTVGLIKALDDGAGDQEDRVISCIEAQLQDYCDRNGLRGEGQPDSEEDLPDEKMNRLTEPERKVLTMRFGLQGEESRTAAEVAQLLGCSVEEVSGMQRTALRKLNGTKRAGRNIRVLRPFEE